MGHLGNSETSHKDPGLELRDLLLYAVRWSNVGSTQTSYLLVSLLSILLFAEMVMLGVAYYFRYLELGKVCVGNMPSKSFVTSSLSCVNTQSKEYVVSGQFMIR